MNKFFMARYGMFAGMDAKRLFGMIDYDPSLIEQWEKPKELHRIWTLAVMSSLIGGNVRWEELEPYRKKYTEGKEYKAFLGRDAGHESNIRSELAKEAIKKRDERKKQALLAKMKEKEKKETLKLARGSGKAAELERKQMEKYAAMSSDSRGML